MKYRNYLRKWNKDRKHGKYEYKDKQYEKSFLEIAFNLHSIPRIALKKRTEKIDGEMAEKIEHKITSQGQWWGVTGKIRPTNVQQNEWEKNHIDYIITIIENSKFKENFLKY